MPSWDKLTTLRESYVLRHLPGKTQSGTLKPKFRRQFGQRFVLSSMPGG